MVFFRKFDNTDRQLKNIRMGFWVKNRLPGGTFPRMSYTPGSSVNAGVGINQLRSRGNVGKGGHLPSSPKGESISQ